MYPSLRNLTTDVTIYYPFLTKKILFSATSCLDLDECQVNENVCRNGKCENVVGSFNCICDDGYSVKEKLEGDAKKI